MPEDSETPDKIPDSPERSELNAETSPPESTPSVTPAGAPSPVETQTPEPPASDETPAHDTSPPQVVVGNHKRGPSKLWWLLLVLIVLAASAGYLVHKHKTTKTVTATTATKRDIPLLNYGVVDQLTQTYPLGASTTTTMSEINSQLFEGLVHYQQLTKLVPQLATSWYNPNDTTWVFNLRHNVHFHNGRLMTAQDVKASLDYAVAHQNDANAASALANASTIKQVDVVGDNQIKITTDGPDATLLNRLSQLFIFDSKSTLGDPNSGTAPYMLKPGTTPTATSMDLVASKNYWGGHIFTRAIHIGANTDNSQLAAEMGAGKFDVAGDFTNDQIPKLGNHKIINIDDLGVTFLGLNTLKSGSPLTNLQARQAASYALNIPAIIKAGNLSGKQANQLIPTTILGHDPTLKNIPYDPAKAKQLLASVKNANTPLTLSFPAGDEGQVNEIAKELNAVGFNVKTSVQPDVGSLVNIAFAGQSDMFYLAYDSGDLDGLDIIQNVVTVASSDYQSSDINNLVDQAGKTLDPATRIKLLQEISQKVASDIPDIPLYTQTRTYAVNKNYHLQVDIPGDAVGAYFWQVYQQ
jgi:peptide/nickel transport system substrate-binding protein